MSNNSTLAFKEGYPVSESGSSWIFVSNLMKHLDGSFELVFIPKNLLGRLQSNSKGNIKLQTKDGSDVLFVISDVRHDRFEQLVKLFGKEAKCALRKEAEEMTICKTGCHTAGHYECWRDNCDCICHAARRVLGVALPKSYTPVPG